MLFNSQFSLYDAMSATEACDPKIDFRVDLELTDTPEKMLQQKRIKPAEELSLE